MENDQATITDAVILMAGIGSRLGGELPKPLVEIAGQPLIRFTLETLRRAGVTQVHLVVGSHSGSLAESVSALAPSGLRVDAIVNHEWQKQNGVSVLCAEGKVRTPFFLTMGDHLFEPALFDALVAGADRAQVNLAVDRKIASIFDLDDAMKVQIGGERIHAIAKNLPEYNAIDTGAFLCSADIFRALRAAQRGGDCSLADGIRLLAQEGKVRAVDIGDAWWQDVDTPEMLGEAQRVSARFLRESGRGLAQESVRGQE